MHNETEKLKRRMVEVEANIFVAETAEGTNKLFEPLGR